MSVVTESAKLDAYRGARHFPAPYQVMFAQDVHAPGSVDRVLVERMVLLCSATAGLLYAPHVSGRVQYVAGTRPELEAHAAKAVGRTTTPSARVAAIARFCADLARRADERGVDAMWFGGTEEEIIERTTDWASDLARVACTLYQVAGMPARIAILADLSRPYHGHAIVEVFRDRAWGAVDPMTNVIYLHPDGSPASVWDLVRDESLIWAHRRDGDTPFTDPLQFGCVALTDYFVEDAENYRYAVTGLTPAYRRILELAAESRKRAARWLRPPTDD